MIKAIDIRKPSRAHRLRKSDFTQVTEMIGSQNLKTPFLILSRSAIRKNLADLAAALPGAAICYAVKSNNHPAILEEVAAAGHNFDVASFSELQQAVEAGGHADKCIHSHPIKSPLEIENAVKAGANTFVIDNSHEIDKFIPYADKVRLLIRFKVADSSAVVDLSYKFGCEPDEALGLAEKIRRYGLNYYGMTFHVGSQCVDNSVYVRAVKMAGSMITELKNHGFDTIMLDIGGGFPVQYTDAVPSIEIFCAPIKQALADNIDPDIIIACEPGRFISAPAVTLVASIIGKSNRSGKSWYFLDDGLYGSFSGRLYDHCQYQVFTNRNTVWRDSVLAGPTCDSFDVIYDNILLPPLELGNLLLFPAMGAYCSVSASTFNSLRKAEYIVVE
ncbi:MAG: type III PLP-dependent enzyme [candidate division Zixibacteria bacterium HGW-Zixibacteria-1]|nr:MAG: type III PLP-dependent enzyme [candidate division Zixibacteria bacterium HGW-Zixibacteria-1]